MKRPVTWSGVGVQTRAQLERKHHHLDRRALSVEAVVNRMHEGALLHLQFDRRRGPVWRLSVIGAEVPDATARAVIQHPDVIAVGDSLFAGCLSQTYRFAE